MENRTGFRIYGFALLLVIFINQANGQGFPATGLKATAARTPPNNRNAVISSRLDTRNGNNYVLFSAQQASFQWFFDNNTVVPNSWSVSSNIANVRGGLWVDSKNQWDNTTRRAIVCHTDRSIWQWTPGTNNMLQVYTVVPINGESGNTQTSCLIDFEYKAAYFGHFRVISKLLISNAGGAWTGQRDAPRRSATSAEIRSMALDTYQGYVYFGLGSGELLRIRRNETRDMTTAPFEVFGPLGGEVISLAVDGISNYMFIGTSFGLGMRFPLGAYSGSYDFFFFGQSRLETILLDDVNRVTYWTTDSGWFYRVDHENFLRYRDSTFINCTGFPTCTYTVPLILSGGVMDTSAGVAYVSTGNTGGTGQIIQIQLYNCSMFSTCNDCVTNSKYCDWCIYSRTCSKKSTCVGSPTANTTNSCPNLISVTPNSGSIYGNTTVTVTANVFPNNANRVNCRFDLFNTPILKPVTIIDSSTITCQTPLNYGIARPIAMDIVYDNIPFTDSSLNFTFYDCTGTSCGSCSDALKPECGWCLAEGICRNSYLCGTPVNFAQSTCPQLFDISPNSGEDSGGTVVTITGSYFPNTNLLCKFGNFFSNATIVNSTMITCSSPGAVTTGNSIVPVSVVYGIDTSRPYASGNLTFIYFNCDQSTSCSNCIQGFCVWCVNTATCRSINSTSPCANTVTTSTECPALSSVTPDNLYFSDVGQQLTISGAHFLPATPGQYKCRFSNIGDANTTWAVTPASFVSASTLTCASVAQVTAGISYLSVTYNNLFFASENIPLNHYDCVATDCDSCQQTSRPKCDWCVGSSICSVNTIGCSNDTVLSSCPRLLSISPSRSHVSGNTTVFVVANTFIDGLTYYCDFGGNIVSAQRLNSTTVTCISPNGTSGTFPFRILNSGYPYTSNSLSFFYFECSDLGLDCQGCLDYPGCVFCLPYTCQSVDQSSNCPIGFDTLVCPSLISISPDHAPVGGNVTVLISGGKFIPNTDYQCGVDGIGNFTADFVDSSTLQCVLPAQSQYQIVTIRIYSGGNEYSKDTLSFEFYDCSFNYGQSNCSSCSVNPSSYCGWCLYSQSCGTIESCPNAFGWTSSVCPSIGTVYPTFDSVEGNSTININGTLFVDGVDYECKFGQVTVMATRVSDSLLQCRSPATSLRKRQGSVTVPLSIYSGNRQFSSNSFSFDILDCSYTGERLCTSCMSPTNDPRCDWCLVDNLCGPSHRCINQWGPISDAIRCPVLVSMYPLTGNFEENTTVDIQASLFVDHPTLRCSFGGVDVDAEFINDTLIRCVAPPHNETGPVQVFVWINGDKLASNFLLFEYVVVEPPVVVSGSPQDILPVTLGTLGAAVALSLIVIVAAILVIRRRRALKKLPEPDYISLAFAGALPDYELDKDTAEKLEGLEELLLSPDFGLVTAICDTTQLSDVDQITKAIIYVYESNNHSVDIIKHFITREVQSSDTEGSLFRSNSIVSKMASHYGKMIGLPYLWRTLALPIHELNDLGSGEVEASKYKTEVGMRSIMTPSSMEVDPTKLDQGEDATVNQLQLMLISQKLFGAITKSVEYLPTRLRQIYRHIKFEVNRKYAAHVYKSVSSFLFLRYICPSILAPHVYGLLQEPPNQECQRYLILISKTLQSLANGSLPGKKEDYMQKMNDFITNNSDALRNFIDSVTAPVDADQLTPMTLPRGLRFNALAFLYEHIYLHNTSLKKYLEEQPNGKDLTDRLQNLLERVGSPAQVKK